MILKAKPPFDFRLSAGISRDFDGEELRLPLRSEVGAVLVRIRGEGTVEEPELSAELESKEALSGAERNWAIATVSRMLNLDMDLRDFYESTDDEILLNLMAALRGLKVIHTCSVFEALVYAITEQQISLDVAMRIEQRITERFGEPIDFGGKRYHVFPEPERLDSIEDLKRCGLSTRKAEYIRDISAAVSEGGLELENLRDCERTEEIIEELCALRGIGQWTAKMTVMRSMPRYDVLPADDVGIRRCISRYYFNGIRISLQQAEETAERWGAYKGLAAYYLVRATILGL